MKTKKMVKRYVEFSDKYNEKTGKSILDNTEDISKRKIFQFLNQKKLKKIMTEISNNDRLFHGTIFFQRCYNG